MSDEIKPKDLQIEKSIDFSKYGTKKPGSSKKANFFIIGPLGAGKTTSAISTSPRPVLGHSFDPEGFQSVRHLHDGESVILDSQFEQDDPFHPTKFTLWDKIYHQMKRDKVFERISTYVLDSATSWTDCAMNEVLKRAGRAGMSPVSKDWKHNDYSKQKTMVFNAIMDLLSLPCNVIVIGHPATYSDEVSGKVYSAPMLVGALKEKVPLMFSEIYYAQTSETSTGTEYKYLTQPSGLYQARTKLGQRGQLNKYEPQDITAILKKVGVL